MTELLEMLDSAERHKLDDSCGNSHCSPNVPRGAEVGVKAHAIYIASIGGDVMEADRCAVKTQVSTVSGAAAELFELQVSQFRHDEFYHREIARLTVHGRLNHMALHFCKYVGQLAEALSVGHMPKIQRAIVDAFIIDLCAANALNVRLSSFMPEIEAVSLSDLSRRIAIKSLPQNDARCENGAWLITAFSVEAGNVARACEKIDHLEDFPFRQTITKSLGSICSICLIASENFGFNLVYEARKRLREVEEKFVFHDVV